MRFKRKGTLLNYLKVYLNAGYPVSSPYKIPNPHYFKAK
jgi:hypothetical protein